MINKRQGKLKHILSIYLDNNAQGLCVMNRKVAIISRGWGLHA
jgi:hypothetical protein